MTSTPDLPAADHTDQHAYDLPYHWCMGPFHKYVVEQAMRRVNHVVRGRTVLEVGCGDGFVTSLLASHAKRVIAFDLNPRAIQFAQLIVRAPNTTFEIGRAADVATIGETFGPVDVVAAFEVFEHLSETERSAFLQGVMEVLGSRGGWLILTTPNRARRRKARNPHHTHEFTASELTQLLPAYGLTSVSITGLYLQPPWERLEHFANVVPFRAPFRALARAGIRRPRLCRSLVCIARVTAR